MIPNNPFRDAQGKAVNPFKGDAKGFDEAIEQVKRHGSYLSERTWHYDLHCIVQQLRQEKSGWLCFIEHHQTH